ncbi:MFS general substrate transporter [Multifurca ochricompacta]|uniref:MFS general substrate transporter n=1 Tax=Multifurca ochricompacta TaxID=376703 RepID=A0AAD4QNV7_9AGAM|nr:MFS general substrate transporter [Multifurca ochricompacta]
MNNLNDAIKKESRPWSSYIWDSWNKSPEERKFLRRLDACLITYAALSYFSKYLDQQNVTNAYVSGMKEDLHLHGNQLNYITTSWTVGYVIGQIPSKWAILAFRFAIDIRYLTCYIPAMELLWSVLTMCLATSKNFTQVCALRFLVGLAESTFYPAIQYVIGSWYKKEELAKRSCIFHTASAVGPMVSGFLQAGVYNGLNGKGGLAGWKCDSSLDVFSPPNLPTTTKPSIFYTQEQLDIAKKRMDSVGRKPPAHFTKKKVLGFFSTWHIYALVPRESLINTTPESTLSLSFNKPGHIVYTIGQINTYPLGNIFNADSLIYAWWSDAIMARWPPILLAGTWSLITYAVLAATPVYSHISRRWTFYYFTGCMGGLSGLIMAWVNELNSHDNEKRAFIVASCNMWAYVVQAWLPLVIFPQVEQPTFKGNPRLYPIFIYSIIVVVALTTRYLQRRDERRVVAAFRGGEERGNETLDDVTGRWRKAKHLTQFATTIAFSTKCMCRHVLSDATHNHAKVPTLTCN